MAASGASLTAVIVCDRATAAEEMCVAPPVAPVRSSVAPLMMVGPEFDQVRAQRRRRPVVVRHRYKAQEVSRLERDRRCEGCRVQRIPVGAVSRVLPGALAGIDRVATNGNPDKTVRRRTPGHVVRCIREVGAEQRSNRRSRRIGRILIDRHQRSATSRNRRVIRRTDVDPHRSVRRDLTVADRNIERIRAVIVGRRRIGDPRLDRSRNRVGRTCDRQRAVAAVCIARGQCVIRNGVEDRLNSGSAPHVQR